jgi:hypothetical protein
MLTDAQVDHFRTFGLLVLPGYLNEQETTALAAELDRAHRDAFGARYDERPGRGGIDGHYLPMMSRDRTPRSLALVEDPRFLAAARQLIGAAVLPPPPAPCGCCPGPTTPSSRPSWPAGTGAIRLAFLLDDLDDYDHAAYPPYDDHWLAPDPAHPKRVVLSDRMRALGMFKVVERA